MLHHNGILRSSVNVSETILIHIYISKLKSDFVISLSSDYVHTLSLMNVILVFMVLEKQLNTFIEIPQFDIETPLYKKFRITHHN